MYNSIDDIREDLVAYLIARDFNTEKLTDKMLDLEIKLAIGEINRCRRFTPTTTQLYDSKYEYLIIPMCTNSIAKIGAEGQTSHSENGIARSYDKSLTSQIIPLI